MGEDDAFALLATRFHASRLTEHPKTSFSLIEPDPTLLIWDKNTSGYYPTTGFFELSGWLKVPLSHEDVRVSPDAKVPHVCLRIMALTKSENPSLGAMLMHCGGPGSDRMCAHTGANQFGQYDFAFLGISQRGVQDAATSCPFEEADGAPVTPFPYLSCDEIYKTLSAGLGQSNYTSVEAYSMQVERLKNALTDFMGEDAPEPSEEDIKIMFAILRYGGLPVDGVHGVTYLNETYVRWYYRLVQLESTLCTDAPRYNSLRKADGQAYNLFRYTGTEDLAQDIDVFRRAIGQNKLSIYGLSYGTVVGSNYATLFPNHTDRLVLDGVIPPVLETHTLPTHQQKGYSNVFEAVFTDCFESLYRNASEEERCPLAPSPSSKVQHMINDKTNLTRAAAVANYFDNIACGNDNACIDGAPATVACAAALYEGAQTPEYCNVSAVSEAKPENAPLGPGTENDRFYETQKTIMSAVIGLDAPGRYGEEALIALWQDQLRAYGMSVRHYIEWMVPCSTWPMYSKPLPPAGNERIPALVIGNLHDQATDFGGAQLMRQAFPSGSLMTYQGFGHCLAARSFEVVGATGSEVNSVQSINHCKHLIDKYLETLELPFDGHACHLYSPLSLGPAAVERYLQSHANDSINRRGR